MQDLANAACSGRRCLYFLTTVQTLIRAGKGATMTQAMHYTDKVWTATQQRSLLMPSTCAVCQCAHGRLLCKNLSSNTMLLLQLKPFDEHMVT